MFKWELIGTGVNITWIQRTPKKGKTFVVQGKSVPLSEPQFLINQMRQSYSLSWKKAPFFRKGRNWNSVGSWKSTWSNCDANCAGTLNMNLETLFPFYRPQPHCAREQCKKITNSYMTWKTLVEEMTHPLVLKSVPQPSRLRFRRQLLKVQRVKLRGASCVSKCSWYTCHPTGAPDLCLLLSQVSTETSYPENRHILFLSQDILFCHHLCVS